MFPVNDRLHGPLRPPTHRVRLYPRSHSPHQGTRLRIPITLLACRQHGLVGADLDPVRRVEGEDMEVLGHALDAVLRIRQEDPSPPHHPPPPSPSPAALETQAATRSVHFYVRVRRMTMRSRPGKTPCRAPAPSVTRYRRSARSVQSWTSTNSFIWEMSGLPRTRVLPAVSVRCWSFCSAFL